jgi:hypothetical protein
MEEHQLNLGVGTRLQHTSCGAFFRTQCYCCPSR